MELRRLRYFLAVAEELNFTRAAARLQMAQPPLSAQIQVLEGELGVTLFDRSRRAVSLTPAGRALVPEARRLLADAEQTARIVRHADDGTVGRLAVGFVPAAVNGVLPDILRRYRADCPGVVLSLHECSPDDLISQLHEHRIEAAFLFAPLADDTLLSRCVSAQHLVAALPEGHPLARGATVDARALAAGPMILPTQHETPGLFSRIRLLFDELGIAPNVVQREVWMMQTIVGLVAAELGAAIVPSSVALTPREGVVYLPLEQETAPVEMTVAWRRGAGSAARAAFVAAATSERYDIPAPAGCLVLPGIVVRLRRGQELGQDPGQGGAVGRGQAVREQGGHQPQVRLHGREQGGLAVAGDRDLDAAPVVVGRAAGDQARLLHPHQHPADAAFAEQEAVPEVLLPRPQARHIREVNEDIEPLERQLVIAQHLVGKQFDQLPVRGQE
jgi:DNA-binding transcriptional LysR family regulator